MELRERELLTAVVDSHKQLLSVTGIFSTGGFLRFLFFWFKWDLN